MNDVALEDQRQRSVLSRPEYEVVLPFSDSCVDGCCALGHTTCNTNEDNLNRFGEDFEETFSWNFAICSFDSDGDGYTNGDELGDPCCLWNYKENGGVVASPLLFESGRTHPGDSLEYPANRQSCGSADFRNSQPPLDLSLVSTKVGSQQVEVDWSQAIKDPSAPDVTPCFCRVTLRVNGQETFEVPWGLQKVVLPITSSAADSSEMTLAFKAHNVQYFSTLYSSPLSIAVPGSDLRVDSEPLTVSDRHYPIAPVPKVEEKKIFIAYGAPVAFGAFLVLSFVFSRLASWKFPQTFSKNLAKPPKPTWGRMGWVGMVLVLGGLSFVLDFFNSEFDERTRTAYALGEVCLYLLLVICFLSLRREAQFVCGTGWEVLVVWHGVFATFLIAVAIAHAVPMTIRVGWSISGGTPLLGLVTLIGFGTAGWLLPNIHRMFPKILSYDIFRFAHWGLYVFIVLSIIHALGSRGAILGCVLLGVLFLRILSVALLALSRVLRANATIAGKKRLGNDAVALFVKTEVVSAPGQWVSVRVLQGIKKFIDANPFTAVPIAAVKNIFPELDGERGFALCITRGGGRFTKALIEDLEVPANSAGLAASVMGPYGGYLKGLPAQFLPCDRILFIVGGSGVTPALSLIPEAVRRGKEVHFFWNFRNLELGMVLAPYITEFCPTPSSSFHCTTKDQQGGDVSSLVSFGRGSVEEFIKKVSESNPESSLGIFACGPESLYSSVFKGAKGLKKVDAIHCESFKFIEML